MPATVNIGTLEGLLRWKADDAELNKSLDTVAKKADISRGQLNKYNKELGSIDAAYRRVAASLDPTIARTQKYDASVEALDRALKASLITQSQYTALLSKAQLQLQSTTHWTQRLGLEIGSNLKSQFLGTIGVAALLGTALSAVSSVTRQLASATIEAEASQRRAQEAARRYGDVSGITAKRIDEIAQSLSKLSGIDDEAISDAEVLGAKFNRISEEIFPRFSKAALDLSVATGLDLPAAFEKAGKIVNQPLKGLTLLSREGYAVSKSQSDMVKSFLAAGDVMSAQGIMLGILESQYEGAAEAARDSLGGAITALGTTWENFLEKVGEDSAGPLRKSIELLIDLLEDLTGFIDEASIGWGFLTIKALETERAFAQFESRFSFGKHAKDLEKSILNLDQRIAKSYKDTYSAMARQGKIPEDIAKSLGLLNEETKKRTRGALEQTDAERKLAEEVNKVSAALRSAAQAIVDYNNLISDEIDIVGRNLKDQVALADALAKGQVQYEQTLLSIERSNAVETETLKITRAHRAEIEKLTETREKLKASLAASGNIGGQSAAIEKITADINAENAAFEKQVEVIGSVVGRVIDLKQETSSKLAVTKSDVKFSEDLRTVQAELADALNLSSKATRENAIQLEIEHEQLRQNALIGSPLAASIERTIRLRHEEIDGIRAHTASVIANTEAQRNLANLKAQFTDWQAVTNATRKYGSELSSILEQHGLLSNAVREQQIQEEALARFRSQSNADQKKSLEEFIAIVRSEQIALAEVQQAWANADIHAWIVEPFQEAFDSVQSSFLNTTNEMILTGEANWESFWDGFKRQALEAIEQWLIRWIKAQRLAQAESIRTAKVNAAASQGGGLVQGQGGVTGLTGSATSIGMTGGGVATTGGFNWAAVGSAIGWAAVAIIWAKVLGGLYEGFTKGKLKFGEASFEGGASGTGKMSRQVAEVVEALLKDVNKTIEAWNLGITKVANITIRVTEKGEFTVRTMLDPWGKMFRSMEEAVEYAKTQAIKLAEFSDSASKLVVAAIRGSEAEDSSGLLGDIDFARMLESQNLPDIANQMQALLQTAVGNFHRAMELFAGDLTQMEVAIGSILTNLTTNVQALYNNLMGIKEDPKEVWRRQRDAYNLQRAIMIAQLTLLYEEIKARILLFQTQQLTLQGFERGTIDRPSGREGPRENLPRQSGSFKGGWNPNEPVPDNRNPDNNPVLQNLLNILDNLGRAMLNLPPEITGDMPRGFGGRGGGGGSRDSARDFLADRRFQSSLLGLSEVERAIKQLNREYEEQLKNAGKDSKLRAELIKQREEETARIREDNKKDVAARYDELIGNTDAFDQVSKQFEDMGKEVKDAGFGARRTARMLGELTAAEDKAIRVLSMQKYADLLGGLAQYIDDAVLKQELLAAQAQIKFTLEMEAFRVEFALLKEKGKLTQAQIDAVERAFDYIDKNMPDFNGGGLPGGGEGPDLSGMIWTGQGWIPAPANDNVNPLTNAQDLLQRYIDAGRDAYQLDLERLNDDFDIIRAAMGDTAQVAEQFALAMERLNDQYLGSLQDVYDQLSGGELGGFGLEEQTAQAQAQYESLLARVQAGDLGQADALAAAAENWIQLYSQTYGSSTGGFGNIREQIRQALAGILGVSPSLTSGLSNLIGGPERFSTGINSPQGGIILDLNARDERTWTATNRVADVVISQSTKEQNLLIEIRNYLRDIKNGNIGNGSGSTANSSIPSGISYGDNDSRGKPLLPIKKVS